MHTGFRSKNVQLVQRVMTLMMDAGAYMSAGSDN